MPEEKMELMYRAPGRTYHQNIAEILDEVMKTLENLQNRVTKLENGNATVHK